MNIVVDIWRKKNGTFITLIIIFVRSVQLAWIIDAGWFRLDVVVLCVCISVCWCMDGTAMSFSENSRRIFKKKDKKRQKKTETHTYTMKQWRRLRVWMFKHSIIKCIFFCWLFTRLVNSYAHTIWEWMNKWRGKNGEFINTACCMFIVYLRVFDDVLLQITQHIRRMANGDLILSSHT